MEKLIFKPRATFTHDLNYLSKVDSTIINEVHSAIDYLCERGRLAKEFDDHQLMEYMKNIVSFIFEILLRV